MPDIFLYPVPSDPNQNDVRLRDPTTLYAPGAAAAYVPLTRAAAFYAALAVPALGFAAQSRPPMAADLMAPPVDAGADAVDPGTKPKPWLYEVPLERPDDEEQIAARSNVISIHAAPSKRKQKIAARRAVEHEDDEEAILMLLTG